ncbi:unnamed protein product [Lathyrus sativus]|nr:unnamed protein product [Lathyrus sativus]
MRAYTLKEKFKLLKASLKKWYKEVFGIIDLKIDNFVEDLKNLDSIINSQSSISPIEVRKEAQNLIWSNLHLKEILLKQKSRQKWIKEGDLNSRFFHNMMTCRRRKNYIIVLNTGRGRMNEVTMIKAIAIEHFKHRFTDPGGYMPSVEGVNFSSLTEADNSGLEKDFSRDEIKGVIWDCDGDKSPVPDRFNFTFLENF